MISAKRPYLIISRLIEQPTWGGSYILEYKNWANKEYLNKRKIGQSYELYGQSKLLLNINDSSDSQFIGELSSANSPEIINDNFNYSKGKDYLVLSEWVKKNPEETIGEKAFAKFQKMPLLIKFTQAAGNSFQLHVKQSAINTRWKPKAESWYYFEDGLLTYGINNNTHVDDYKKACKLIETKMKQLSRDVKNNTISLDKVKEESKKYIKEVNPWQFVNVHEVGKNTLVDLSGGGIHHSWEENKEKYPLGNILYEIQQDVTDPESTLRSFDQGKIGNNGEIRQITIDDYFTYLDTDLNHNDIKNALLIQKGSRLLSTPYYSLDVLNVKNKKVDETNGSFVHLFVREGNANIETEEGHIYLTKGHSCFIPQVNKKYIITSNDGALILKTFIG